ncbi:hypothetical protein GF360_04150 [candidate division WWE3 bacterium]|nr:hypothetical protein [candidate division WWE3 bacterium]
MSFIIFILILSVLVLIHELGHFLTAKKMGVAVEEFGLGIPPRIYGKKIGETIYSLNLLPFGGFVRLKGEDSYEYSKEDLKDPQNFISKTPLQRAAILLAGVVMNTLFGVALFYVFMVANGSKTSHIPLIFDHAFEFGEVRTVDTVVFSLDEKSPLKDKMEPGEAIVFIGASDVNWGTPVDSVEEIREAVATAYSMELSVEEESLEAEEVGNTKEVVVRVLDLAAEKERSLTITPYLDEEGDPLLGVYLGSSAQIFYQEPAQKLASGFLHAYNVLGYSTSAFGKLIGLSVEQGSAEPLSESVSGPVGIYSLVENIVSYSKGSVGQIALNLIDLTALISVSLAVLNVLPLPALDGGRVLFIAIESVRGKRVSPKVEAAVHKAGILVLMSLLLLVSVRDVIRIF